MPLKERDGSRQYLKKAAFRPIWLPGRDSNPRPIGYKGPDISARLGLSHHPPTRMSGAFRGLSVRDPQPLVSARSCLLTPIRQASLRITMKDDGSSFLGFPEFTRFFNPPCDGKLQLAWSSRWQLAQTRTHLSISARTCFQPRVYPFADIPKSLFADSRWWISSASAHRS
jgi:hypothetical protein